MIFQQNNGFSGARNTGLKKIQGTYIMFLDSDDLIPEDAIENMLNVAFKTQADIVQGSWLDFTNKTKVEHHTNYNGIINNSKGILSGFPWGKLYKHHVLEHFCFPEGFWYEDTPILFTGID